MADKSFEDYACSLRSPKHAFCIAYIAKVFEIKPYVTLYLGLQEFSLPLEFNSLF